MGSGKCRKTSAKVDIPDSARKEIEYLFHHDIVSYVEEFNIPHSLIYLDQTSLKYVPVSNETMAKRNSLSVVIEGSNDKHMITGTFPITLSRNSLPMYLIYGGKNTQSIPRVKFPQGFCLSSNPKHFSNTEESFLDEVIISYVIKERSNCDLPEDQKALMVIDVFMDHTTPEVITNYQENNIIIVNVPANMTTFYQPLDLTVNGFPKRFLKDKCNIWYSQQISKQLAKGIVLGDVQIKSPLSTLKPLHAGWMKDLYNEMTSDKGVDIIKSGWRAVSIADAISLGLRNLPSIDPFDDIDSMLELGVDIGDGNIELITAVANLTTDLVLAASKESMSSDDDSNWEDPVADNHNAFNIFNEEAL